MWWWDQLIENRIREAEEKGQFDDLPGSGKPLNLDERSGEQWLENHLMKEAGMLPEWLQLRKEISEERPVVRAALAEYYRQVRDLDPRQPRHVAIHRRLKDRYVHLARDINRKIDRHNVLCPSMELELIRFQEDVVERSPTYHRHY